jgi:translation initiation factor 5A
MMDMENYATFESPQPDDAELKASLAAGVEVEYWDVLGRKMIVRKKG